MIKYFENDYKGFENEISVIKLEPNFEKIAYAFGDPIKEFIENKVKPTKGSNFYLINAMGSGQVYGSNSRGDYWPREELKKYHKTFETTPAAVYVQHRNKDRNIRLGDVLFSHFNDDTDRVELVQRIDWDRVFKYAPPWVKTLLQTDQPYSTSMGAIVDHEICSVCQKKSKLMNQRCDHLNHHMNQFVDGTKVYAINIKPKFFDNSIVMRGADKIARSLKKVASDFDDIFNAEETILNDAELSGKSYFIFDSEKSTKVDKLAEDVVFIREDTIDKIASDSFYLSKNFIDSILEYELKDILGVTKIAGAELLPHEYQYIVLKKLGQDEEAENRWNNLIRFKLQDHPSENNSKLALGYNRDLLDKFAEAIPYRSYFKPFVFYRGLSKIASEVNPIKWTVIDEPILSKAYADYVSRNVEKVADMGTILPFLSTLFLLLPSLMALEKSTARNKKITDSNIRMIQDTKNRASEIPILPYLPNPVYHNPLFQAEMRSSAKPVYVISDPTKIASIGSALKNFGNKVIKNPVQNVGTRLKNKAPITFHWGVPAAVGATVTASLAGKDKEKEMNGDPTAGTGIYGMAHKHPIMTGVGATLLGHVASKKLVKGGSEKDLSNYKEFLKTASQEQLLEFLGKIPDDLFFLIIND